MPNIKDLHLINLEDKNLPLLDESIWIKNSPLKQLWQPYSNKLKNSTGFIFVLPEWGGMAPASIKNFFLYCQDHELAHKPALIISITSGIAGAYPIAELRMSSYKNTHICYIPENIILRYIEKFLDQYETPKEEPVIDLKERLLYSLKILRSYDKSLSTMRSEGVIDLPKFPNGM